MLWEISQLLNTGLDRESLFLSIQLLEQNVNPEALAAVIKELTREAQAIQVCAPPTGSFPYRAAVPLTRPTHRQPQVRATGCTRRRRQRGAERTLSFVRRLYIK